MLVGGAGTAQAAAAPSVSKVSPGSGSTAGGTKVTVSGHNFTHVHSVSFGSAAGRSLHVVSSTKLTVTAPQHSAGTVRVRVHARAGTSPKGHPAEFTYTTTGAIAGTVTAKAGGRRLSDVDVEAFTPAGQFVGKAVTRSDGSYRIHGLHGSHSYDVCFDAEGVIAGSATGYADECYRHTAWNGPPAGVPVSAQAVRVTAGRTTDIDAALATAGAISGTVIAADDSAPLRHVLVSVIDRGEESTVSSALTDSSGHYTLVGLRRLAPGYDVCFDGSLGKGGPSAAGYVDQCYDSTAWDGSDFNLPPDATVVPASAGSPTPNIDAALDSAATISGTVTATSDGTPLSTVAVLLFAVGDTSQAVAGVETDADGHFLIAGLGTGVYNLCFTPTVITGGPSGGGYLQECYNDKLWDGFFSDIPGAAASVHLTAGKATRGKNADLASAGGIAGRVTETGGAPLRLVVDVYHGGNIVASDSTNANGDYKFLGLPPASGYQVCFDGSAATDSNGDPVPDLQDECFDDAVWDGISSAPPGGATVIDVPEGDVIPDIDAVLSQV
jgi:hypothetical protein